MALDTIPKQEGGKLKAVASGTLPSGQPVIVNADGTVSVIAETSVSESVGTATVYKAASSIAMATAYDPVNNKVLILWSNQSASSVGTGVVGTISGTSISFGSETVWDSGNRPEYIDATYDVSSGKIVFTYSDGNNADYGKAVVATISGTSVSFGTPVVYQSSGAYHQSIVYDPSAEKVVVAWRDSSTATGRAAVGTVSGTSISFGSTVNFVGSDIWYNNLVYDPVNQQVVNVYLSFVSNPYAIKAVAGTVSGTSITFGSESSLNSDNTRYLTASYDENTNKIVAAYTFESVNEGAARVLTISGTSVTSGTEATWSATQVTWISSVYHPLTKKVYITFTDNGNSDYRAMIPATVSGTNVTFGSKITLLTNQSAYGSSTYDSTSKVLVHVYRGTASDYGYVSVIQTPYAETNLTSENYIGMSSGVVAVTSSASQVIGSETNFETGGRVEHVSAAYDANAQKVVIAYRDETNSKHGTAIVGTVSGTSISFGTAVVFNADATNYTSVVYDENAQKIVIAYQDDNDSNKGTAIVGTISGTSISFGSPTVFDTDNAFINTVYDSNAQKIVISYDDGGNSDYGTAVVGTVSGTSISFGTPVVFATSDTRINDIAYDSAAQKVVVAYRNFDASDAGTAVVGTVSGTSISFGTPVVFDSGGTDRLSVTYDTVADAVVIFYGDKANSYYGTAIAGTVSGTSISFGTKQVFESAEIREFGATYDAPAQRVVLGYRDVGNSEKGTIIAAKVSGTTLTFDTPEVFAQDPRHINATYDSDLDKVVFAYDDEIASRGRSCVVQVGYENITRGQVASGGAATVDIVGTVSTNQLSLTAGQQYFVQTDGTLGLTAASPSVLAGTAISATKLIVKT